ncbi:hypothetical protein LguiB_001829 [Lonicera macranthoides]
MIKAWLQTSSRSFGHTFPLSHIYRISIYFSRTTQPTKQYNNFYTTKNSREIKILSTR